MLAELRKNVEKPPAVEIYDLDKSHPTPQIFSYKMVWITSQTARKQAEKREGLHHLQHDWALEEATANLYLEEFAQQTSTHTQTSAVNSLQDNLFAIAREHSITHTHKLILLGILIRDAGIVEKPLIIEAAMIDPDKVYGKNEEIILHEKDGNLILRIEIWKAAFSGIVERGSQRPEWRLLKLGHRYHQKSVKHALGCSKPYSSKVFSDAVLAIAIKRYKVSYGMFFVAMEVVSYTVRARSRLPMRCACDPIWYMAAYRSCNGSILD
ncbi:hypothetical protein Tco_0291692 [Tanacetum coccineum]